VKAIINWPWLTNVTEIRSFLDLDGYYCKFAKDFSMITSILTNLLRKTTSFEWTEKCEKGFLRVEMMFGYYSNRNLTS